MSQFLSLKPILSEASSSFTSNCEEVMKQKTKKKMLLGIRYYDAVKPQNPERTVGYLMPLRDISALSGPVKMDICDGDTFTVGRGVECSLTLPENIFEDKEENLMYNKERFHNLTIKLGSFLFTIISFLDLSRCTAYLFPVLNIVL